MSDPRSTLCRKWTTVDDQRIVCSYDRGHEGRCSWETEVDERRDNGPFEDITGALIQFTNWFEGMGQVVSNHDGALMQLLEGALIAGITPTQFEQDYLKAARLDPIVTTILSSWLITAAHPMARRSLPS